MTKRKNELSFMNIAMCMLVIFIHIASWTLPNMDRTSVKYIFLLVPWRLSAFVVQGFLFLSGVKLFSSKKPFSYPTFVQGRFLKIYLPYVLWVCIYYAYFIAIGWYKFSLEHLGIYTLLGTLCSHFYYIIIAMQFYLLMPLWRLLVKKINGVVLSIAAVVLTAIIKVFVHFTYDDRVFFTYLCYFLIGAAVGVNYEKVCAAVKKYAVCIFALFAALGSADAYLTYRQQVYGNYYRYFEVLHLFYCLSAIFALFTLALIIVRGREMPKILSLADRSTYEIYLSHVLFIYIANNAMAVLGINDMLISLLLRGAFTYIVTFACCMGYTFIKEKLYVRRTRDKSGA